MLRDTGGCLQPARGSRRSSRERRRLGWLAHAVALAVAGLLTFAVLAGALGEIKGGLPIVAFLTTMIAVGWLIAWKRPRNPLGWLLLVIPALFASQLPLGLLGAKLIRDAPGRP